MYLGAKSSSKIARECDSRSLAKRITRQLFGFERFGHDVGVKSFVLSVCCDKDFLSFVTSKMVTVDAYSNERYLNDLKNEM